MRTRLAALILGGAVALTGVAATASSATTAPTPSPTKQVVLSDGAGTVSTTVTLGATCNTTVVNGRTYSLHGAVTTGTPTWICAQTPSSPASWRWRALKGAVGPQGPRGLQGPVGPQGKPGLPGGVSGIQADGPYPGATQVTGGNSDKVFKGDEGFTLQTAWVRCDDGKVAVGGGFNVQGGADDNGDTRAFNFQVAGSFPFSLDKGGNFDPTLVQKNQNQSLTPNAWVVNGFNRGTTDLTVRPWVICVNQADGTPGGSTTVANN